MLRGAAGGRAAVSGGVGGAGGRLGDRGGAPVQGVAAKCALLVDAGMPPMVGWAVWVIGRRGRMGVRIR